MLILPVPDALTAEEFRAPIAGFGLTDHLRADHAKEVIVKFADRLTFFQLHVATGWQLNWAVLWFQTALVFRNLSFEFDRGVASRLLFEQIRS